MAVLAMRLVPMQPRLALLRPRALRTSSAAAAVVLFLTWLAPAALRAQDSVGKIEGEDIAVKNPLSVEVENGRTTALLASGSDVTVRTGQARMILTDGGEIGICGPAHFTVLKSNGAVTLALDFGRVHVRPAGPGALTIYTPLVVATPIAISDGQRDATVGLESSGTMCIIAERGAVRVEQQLSGSGILVPQGGEIQLVGGELSTLRGSAGVCQCEALLARKEPAPQKPPEFSVPAPAGQARNPKPAQTPPPPVKLDVAEKTEVPPLLTDRPSPFGASGTPATEEPTYKVFMPPLTFDAAAPAPPPDPDPQTIILMRSVRVQPAAVYRGHVVPAPPPTMKPAPPVQVAQVVPPHADDPPKSEPGIFARFWALFRRGSSKGPCAGAGCDR
jgi:hypothetical protein